MISSIAIALYLISIFLCGSIHAQTNPGFIPGKPLCAEYPSNACPSPANPMSLNQAFERKQDYPILPSEVSGVSGVTVTGVPNIGQVLTATSSSTANWAGVVTGVTAAGDVLCSVGDGTINDCLNISFSQNIVYSGSSSKANSYITISNVALSGTATASAVGIIAPNSIHIGADTVDASASPGYLTALHVQDSPFAGYNGSRVAIQGNVVIVGTPASKQSSVNTVGILGFASIAANQLGTSGAYGNYAGGFFGGNSQVIAKPSATFIAGVVGHEFDVTIQTGASAAEMHAATFNRSGNADVRADYDDSAIAIGISDVAATTWPIGIGFGGYAHRWPFGVDSNLIYAWTRQVGGSSPAIALNGVNFSNVTFQSGGCAFLSHDFCIDPSGNGLYSSTTPPTLVAGQLSLSGVVPAPTPGANGEGAIYLSNVNGLVLDGQGSTNDVSFGGCHLPTGSNVLTCVAFTALAGLNGPFLGIIVDNTSPGTASTTEVSIRNSVGTGATLILNGGSFSGGLGASAFAISASVGMYLQGNGTTAIQINSVGDTFFPSVVTGTPVASACFDSTGKLIQKTTTGPCV